MAQTLVAMDDVKKALGIDDLRKLSGAKVAEFISLIPNMDKDIAMQIINQFPAYTDMAKSMVGELESICDNSIQAASVSQKESIAAYKMILSDLGELLKKETISAEERSEITNKMIMVADRIAAKDSEFKDFLLDVLKVGAPVLGGALLLGALILGVNVKGTKIPQLKK